MAGGKRMLDSMGRRVIKAVDAVVKAILGNTGDACCCDGSCCVLFEVYYDCDTKYFSSVQPVTGDIVNCSYISTPSTAGVWVRDETWTADYQYGKHCRYLYKKTIACGATLSPGDYPEPPADGTGCPCTPNSNCCFSCGVCCFGTNTTLDLSGLSVTYTGTSTQVAGIATAFNAMDKSAMVMGYYCGVDGAQPKLASEYVLAGGTNGPSWWAWSGTFTYAGSPARLRMAVWSECGQPATWVWSCEMYLWDGSAWVYDSTVARGLIGGDTDTGDCCVIELTGESTNAPGGFDGAIVSSNVTATVNGNTCCNSGMVEVLPGVFQPLCIDSVEGDCATGECP